MRQRDIMVALTQRLNVRDEQIMELQNELDSYEDVQRQTEEQLDDTRAKLIHVYHLISEYNATLTEPEQTKVGRERSCCTCSLLSLALCRDTQNFPIYVNPLLWQYGLR